MDIALDHLIGNKICIIPMSKEHIRGLYDICTSNGIWDHLPQTIALLF
ncbi:hypothetical protein [Bacillus sp. FJAT-42315]|nr:hypothetical protein [Bacillus sp. FJAT-42315]